METTKDADKNCLEVRVGFEPNQPIKKQELEESEGWADIDMTHNLFIPIIVTSASLEVCNYELTVTDRETDRGNTHARARTGTRERLKLNPHTHEMNETGDSPCYFPEKLI